MQVKDLQARQGKVDIELEITEKGEPREFQKFGNSGKVCSCKAKDETGNVTITLWNEQVEQVHNGDKIKISNGYVGEWQGELQLSTGKFGNLEVIGKGAAPAPEPTPEDKPTSEPEAPTEAAEEELDVEEERIE